MPSSVTCSHFQCFHPRGVGAQWRLCQARLKAWSCGTISNANRSASRCGILCHRSMKSPMSAVEVVLQYFDGCPNWHGFERQLRQALRRMGLSDSALILQRVETPEDAERLAFHGSPTVLVTGNTTRLPDQSSDPGCCGAARDRGVNVARPYDTRYAVRAEQHRRRLAVVDSDHRARSGAWPSWCAFRLRIRGACRSGTRRQS